MGAHTSLFGHGLLSRVHATALLRSDIVVCTFQKITRPRKRLRLDVRRSQKYRWIDDYLCSLKHASWILRIEKLVDVPTKWRTNLRTSWVYTQRLLDMHFCQRNRPLHHCEVIQWSAPLTLPSMLSLSLQNYWLRVLVYIHTHHCSLSHSQVHTIMTTTIRVCCMCPVHICPIITFLINYNN